MPELWIGGGTCECTACGEFFYSVSAFDKHQVWTRDDPEESKYTRCLTPKEMEKKGMSKNKNGLWIVRAMSQEYREDRDARHQPG